mmetsp:Transcript_16275/g.23171  ORF Transcript_16275/g.23171 Transcript_16275/m.23171 type:complete len:109 (+) Transcript_16275:356-682(+)
MKHRHKLREDWRMSMDKAIVKLIIKFEKDAKKINEQLILLEIIRKLLNDEIAKMFQYTSRSNTLQSQILNHKCFEMWKKRFKEESYLNLSFIDELNRALAIKNHICNN